MNISIIYPPHFQLTLGKELIECFMLMSQTHYDGVCIEASFVAPFSRESGFLAGWLNAVTNFADENGEYAARCDSRTADILAKICENRSILQTAEERNRVAQFIGYLSKAWQMAQQLTPEPYSVPYGCPQCGAVGATPSVTGHGCALCDGTEGGVGSGSPEHARDGRKATAGEKTAAEKDLGDRDLDDGA